MSIDKSSADEQSVKNCDDEELNELEYPESPEGGDLQGMYES